MSVNAGQEREVLGQVWAVLCEVGEGQLGLLCEPHLGEVVGRRRHNELRAPRSAIGNGKDTMFCWSVVDGVVNTRIAHPTQTLPQLAGFIQ